MNRSAHDVCVYHTPQDENGDTDLVCCKRDVMAATAEQATNIVRLQVARDPDISKEYTEAEVAAFTYVTRPFRS